MTSIYRINVSIDYATQVDRDTAYVALKTAIASIKGTAPFSAAIIQKSEQLAPSSTSEAL